MGKLFAPAAALMGRLKYPQRFALITLLFLVPIGLALYMYVTEVQSQVDFADKEKKGTEYLQPVAQLYEHAIQQRLLGFLPIHGLESNADALSAKQAEIDRDFASLSEADTRLGAILQSTDRLNKLKESWEDLKAAPYDALRDFNMATFINDIKSLIVHVADTSNLTLDPAIDTYYLQSAFTISLPETQKRLSEIAALGDRVIARRTLDPEDKAQLVAYTSLLQSSVENTERSLNTTSPETFAAMLQGPLAEYLVTTNFFMTTLNSQLIATPNIMLSMDNWLVAADDALQAGGKLWDATLDPFNSLVTARIEEFTNRRNLTLGVTAAMVILVTYLWIGFYISVKRTARSLEKATQALETGVVDGGLDLDSKDEVSRAAAATFSKLAARSTQYAATIDERTNELSEVAAVLAHHPNGILITDERGVVKILNGSAGRLLRTTFDNAVGHSLVELTNDSDMEELVRVALQMPNQYHTVDTMVYGHILEVGATFVSVSSGKYSGLITLQDVTELRKLQHIQQSSMVAVTR